MKINDYKVGTSFEINCAKQKHIRTGETIYDSFGINKNLAYMWGRKPEDVVKARCTIIEEDVRLRDKFNDKNYDPTFKDDVKVIHLKDFYLEGDGIKQCGLGKGIIDFKFIVETAKKYSPNATLVFEGVVGEDIISSKKLIDSYN